MDPVVAIPYIIALLLSIPVHEFFHAYAASRLGDSTPEYQGRLTLNPLAHLDPLGTLLIFVLLISGLPGIGWGKPVQFNPFNLRNPRRDAAIISLAGPASNFGQALIYGVIYYLVPTQFNEFFEPFIYVNFLLGFFNLIPIPPLDGFKVVNGILPVKLSYSWQSLERYGVLLLLVLIFVGSPILSLLVQTPALYFTRLILNFPF
jgi:Zn-dependent protease